MCFFANHTVSCRIDKPVFSHQVNEILPSTYLLERGRTFYCLNGKSSWVISDHFYPVGSQGPHNQKYDYARKYVSRLRINS